MATRSKKCGCATRSTKAKTVKVKAYTRAKPRKC